MDKARSLLRRLASYLDETFALDFEWMGRPLYSFEVSLLWWLALMAVALVFMLTQP